MFASTMCVHMCMCLNINLIIIDRYSLKTPGEKALEWPELDHYLDFHHF